MVMDGKLPSNGQQCMKTKARFRMSKDLIHPFLVCLFDDLVAANVYLKQALKLTSSLSAKLSCCLGVFVTASEIVAESVFFFEVDIKHAVWTNRGLLMG